MPLYEYTCPKCKSRKEMIRSINDSSKPSCACGSKMEKQFSTPAFRFSGTGAYMGTLMSIPGQTVTS